MNKLIITKYLGATDHKPLRIKAKFANKSPFSGSVTIPYPPELGAWDAFQKAAEALLVKADKEVQSGYFSEWQIVDVVSVPDGYGFIVETRGNPYGLRR